MRTRNLVIGIVLVVTVATATFTFLYSQGSKNDLGIDQAILAPVLVAKGDIQTSQALDPLIEDGVIVEIQVPLDALVAGALSDLRQLRGSTAISLIRKHEQISASSVAHLEEPA